jgi:tetratricopeptide (TPR) repeat protein
MRPFLAELRRRNVYKVGAAYAVVAWIVLQAASLLLPAFGAPEWVFKVLILAIAAGFVLALVFSWAFELTPEGLKRTHEVPIEHSITPQTGRKLDFAIIGLLAIALAVSLTLNLRKPAPPAKRAASIAVLPFTNRSTDPQEAMFVDGVHDELLTSLAKVGSLKVISRTSVMSTATRPRTCARSDASSMSRRSWRSRQRAGDAVRVNAAHRCGDRRAPVGQHVRSEAYDREHLRDPIGDRSDDRRQAARCADARREGAHREGATSNLQAYNLYLAGRQNLYLRKLENLKRARELFEQAIQLDPKFAKAYSGLSDALNILVQNFGALTPDELFPKSEQLLKRALELDDSDADIYASLGLLKDVIYIVTLQPEAATAAEQAFQKAIELNPNHAQAVAWYAGLEQDRGDFPKSIILYQRALELDPLARISQLQLAVGYAATGDYRKALDVWLESARTNPDFPDPFGRHQLAPRRTRTARRGVGVGPQGRFA